VAKVIRSLERRREELVYRYSDLFVECSDRDVKRLYELLSLFFAKCDGLVSSSEVEVLMGDTIGIPFDPYVTPVVRRESILIRLKFLKKYHIDNPKEIIRVLTWGLFATDKIGQPDRKYLAKFVENPDKSFAWFAKDLGVSTSSVFDAYRRLRDKIQFRFNCVLNYPLFKLRHFVVFFKPNEEFRSSMVTREFSLTVNKDTLGEWMWASFVVPNQTRIMREFIDSVKKLSYQVFDDHRLYEVKSYGRSINLSMFDGEKWMPSEDALGVGSFKFAERAEGILPRLNESIYGEKPVKFDAIDFIIACLKYGNARERTSEIRSVLTQYGYRLSPVTISKRLTSLNRAGVFIPTFGFAGLGLIAALAFIVECEDRVRETLYHVFPQFPDCIASRTDKGVMFMVRSTSESAPAISYLVQSSLVDRADRVIVTNRIENMGTRIPMLFYEHWNKEKQYWEFARGYFDLTSKLQ
jgi:DNA-binding Lrp family transcriptional regulator